MVWTYHSSQFLYYISISSNKQIAIKMKLQFIVPLNFGSSSLWYLQKSSHRSFRLAQITWWYLCGLYITSMCLYVQVHYSHSSIHLGMSWLVVIWFQKAHCLGQLSQFTEMRDKRQVYCTTNYFQIKTVTRWISL